MFGTVEIVPEQNGTPVLIELSALGSSAEMDSSKDSKDMTKFFLLRGILCN